MMKGQRLKRLEHPWADCYTYNDLTSPLAVFINRIKDSSVCTCALLLIQIMHPEGNIFPFATWPSSYPYIGDVSALIYIEDL